MLRGAYIASERFLSPGDALISLVGGAGAAQIVPERGLSSVSEPFSTVCRGVNPGTLKQFCGVLLGRALIRSRQRS